MDASIKLPDLKNNLFLLAAHRLPVPQVPVWFMRQAGRCDPEYKKLRERDGRPLEELFQDAYKSIEISLLPQRFGVDALIFFQDILTPLTAMGAPFIFRPGPVLEKPIRTLEQIRALTPIDPSSQLPFVGKAIRGLNQHLDKALPVIGFAGAPVTLACFLIAGQSPMSQMSEVHAWIDALPHAFEELLHRLTSMTIDYLNDQIDHGVHAVQLFESLGDAFSKPVYERFIQPTHERIFAEIRRTVPSILFVKECPYLDLMSQSGASVLGVGSCVDLRQAQAQLKGRMALQGNVDNQILCSGTFKEIEEAAEKCLDEGGGIGHILNLNHGILPATPLENVLHLIECVKKRRWNLNPAT